MEQWKTSISDIQLPSHYFPPAIARNTLNLELEGLELNPTAIIGYVPGIKSYSFIGYVTGYII